MWRDGAERGEVASGLLEPEHLSLGGRELLVRKLARRVQVGQVAEPLQVPGGRRSRSRRATIRSHEGDQEPENEQPDHHEAEQPKETDAGRIAHALAESSEGRPSHQRLGARHIPCTSLVGDKADEGDNGQRDKECAKPTKNGSIHRVMPLYNSAILRVATEPHLNWDANHKAAPVHSPPTSGRTDGDRPVAQFHAKEVTAAMSNRLGTRRSSMAMRSLSIRCCWRRWARLPFRRSSADGRQTSERPSCCRLADAATCRSHRPSPGE